MNLKRRNFVKTAGVAALAFPTIIPSHVFGANAPSNRITVGCIGLGPQGAGRGREGAGRNMNMFMNYSDSRVLAVCDCDLHAMTEAQGKVHARYGNEDCAGYQDFREVIARDDIDVICISTPDHWHMPMSMMALRAGKDVFCEKPSLFITEGRGLTEEVDRRGAVMQWGIEDRSLIKYYRLAGWARTGIIGNLEYVECSLPRRSLIKKLDPVVPIPDHLDWNLWLGPAPEEAYTELSTDRHRWRMNTKFSGGMLTDWGAHLCDTAQVGLGVDQSGPVKVTGTANPIDPSLYDSDVPDGINIECHYANGTRMIIKDGPVGIKFVGTQGWVSCRKWNGDWDASDKGILQIKDFDPDLYWPRPEIEHRDFLDAVKTRTKPSYHAEAGHKLSTTLHLGHLAIRSGRTVHWNPEEEIFTEDSALLKKDKVYHRSARNWEKAEALYFASTSFCLFPAK